MNYELEMKAPGSIFHKNMISFLCASYLSNSLYRLKVFLYVFHMTETTIN